MKEKKCIWAVFELADYRKTQIHDKFFEVFLQKKTNIEILHRLSPEYKWDFCCSRISDKIDVLNILFLAASCGRQRLCRELWIVSI